MWSWQTLVDEAEEMIRDEGQGAITRIYIDLPDIGWRYVSHIGTEGPKCVRATINTEMSRTETETTIVFPGERLLAVENLDIPVFEMPSP